LRLVVQTLVDLSAYEQFKLPALAACCIIISCRKDKRKIMKVAVMTANVSGIDPILGMPKQNNIDEEHEVNDEVEYDDQEIEEIDDLFDDEDKPKKKLGKNKKKIEDDDEKIDDEECEYDYSEIYDEKKENPITLVESSQRITLPKLTKYEKVRLIGTRAKQISLGAKVMIKNTEGLNAIEIAKLELEHKMIPMKVKRVLPDNSVEIWKLSELDLDN
jgi:DNA-directed RNA polymerase I, II, and III subunit RPABC2